MSRRTIGIIATLSALLWLGCSRETAVWPPPPKTDQDRLLIKAAERAVAQFDDWSDVACVVERHKGQWRVQAWKIVHPQAKGRSQCAPWAVRSVLLDDRATVIGYSNHL